MVKTIKVCINIAILSILSFFTYKTDAKEPGKAPYAYQIKTVVIDAGHGGDDFGCKGATSAHEKFVTLKVALLLGKKISETYPNVKVIYTRTTDKFIELHERASIANRNNADLFISIHCNASTSRTPYGTETYVLGLHKSEDNLAVAKRENSVIALEQNYENNYDGFDPNAPESHIMFVLNASAHLEQSTLFAQRIQHHYTHGLERFNRGVKQAGFAVLYRTTMPSVLTEIGFLSNYEEERFLSSENGQNDIANSIFSAFKEYKEILETGSSKYTDGHTVVKPTVEEPVKPKPEPVVVKPVEIPKETPPVVVAPKVQDPVPTPKTEPKTADVLFKIQIAVTAQPINTKYAPYNSISNLHSEKAGNMYRYLVGYYTKYEDASKMLKELKTKGLKDAFIVVYKQGTKLNADESKKYLP